MSRFWRNPEFIRHLRSELRHTRALAVIVLVIVLSLLIGLACWISTENSLENLRNLASQFDGRWNQILVEMEQRKLVEFWRLFYRTLMYIQAGILTFWSLLSCAQSISGERERKTWDFQRINRLSATEMLVGKLLGEPVLAYFIVFCCIPIAVVVGLLARVPLLYIVAAYALIVASALFVGFAGIWLSSLLESRSRGIGIIGALGLYAIVVGSYGLTESDFPGLGAFSPVTGLLGLLRNHFDSTSVARLFGAGVSWPLMSILLYSTFGVWFVVMIVDNIKRDYDEVRPLSRWQAVACATFLNFMLCLLFYPRPQFVSVASAINPRPPERVVSAQNFVTTMVLVNTVILFVVGLATLTPHEQLKLWWRRRIERQASLFSEDGLPWPWLLLSAVAAYAILILGLFVWRRELPSDRELFLNSAVQSFIVCVFVTRDVLFVQWCRLTRLRAPIIKGFLYLCLYYAASYVIASVLAIGSDIRLQRVLNILTPASVLSTGEYGTLMSGSVMLGLVLQLITIGVLVHAITVRLRLSAAITTATAH